MDELECKRLKIIKIIIQAVKTSLLYSNIYTKAYLACEHECTCGGEEVTRCNVKGNMLFERVFVCGCEKKRVQFVKEIT